MPRLIAALPAYNEEGSLPPLLKKFQKVFERVPELDPVLIIVDDGSGDGTADVVRKAAGEFAVKLVQHPKNKGLGEAIKTGLRAALEESVSDRDVIVSMDADDTHPPRHIFSMLKEVVKGADIVIASRYRKGSEQHGVPLNRQVMSLGARFLFWLFLKLPGTRDYTCGYRAYRAGLVRQAFEHYGDEIITRNGFACTDQLLVNLACLGGVTIREVPFILRYDRKQGESKLNLGVTVTETLKLLLDGNRKLRAARKRKQVYRRTEAKA